MRIIISPAKKMNIDTDNMEFQDYPVFLERTEEIKDWLQKLSYAELKRLWACNDKIAELNYDRLRDLDLRKALTPALISYEGIQYQYMAPGVFSQSEWDYVQEHLRILSGFYGVLKPLDGVTPYRLEMQAKAKINGKKDMYDFWGESLYREIKNGSRKILNLASKEYSKCVDTYLRPEDEYVTCVFGEWKEGKVIQKGTQAKMARGEMVHFMAQNRIKDFKELQNFNQLGYTYEKSISTEREYVFIKG